MILLMRSYFVLAYYAFEPILDPHAEVLRQKTFLDRLDAKGRIYISEEGINGQMSIAEEHAERYMEWMRLSPAFSKMAFKVHRYGEHAFEKLIVKYRKQLVAIDCPLDAKKGGVHLSPKEWREMLETRSDHILIDTRNDYEWEVGHFEGAELPKVATFRAFKGYTEELVKNLPKETPVMMYCTGGIRCELYSALLKEKGFSKVYQLEGGVINYGLQEGSKLWKGKLFVFDDRLTVPISDEATETIGKCAHCGVPCDDYYNCASADCNKLLVMCRSCALSHSGCCKEACKESPHLRPFSEQGPHKPFRRQKKAAS